MIPANEQAAQLLEGRVLDGGWRVVKKKTNGPNQTGGIYSSFYEVENGDRKGFLKAFDYSAAAKVTNDFAKEINNITNAFNLEKEILEICRNNGCKNVIEILTQGSTSIPEAKEYPRVDYLILELAEGGDVRGTLQEASVTLEWKLTSLHQIAKGLNELHKLSIAHQDVKPSNIVKLKSGKTKLTDLGSAVTINKVRNDLPEVQFKSFVGTWQYAPPELLYGFVNSDDNIRRIGCDLYLMGSVVAFYFTNLSMTAQINANLSPSLSWTNPANIGKYEFLKSYVIAAFEKALEDLGRTIENDMLRDQLIEVIRYLCNPDPLKRGHKKSIAQMGTNFSLERFITIFDKLSQKVKLKRI
jgi:serine/threonine protein kinase